MIRLKKEMRMEQEAQSMSDAFKAKISELYLLIEGGDIAGADLEKAREVLKELQQKLYERMVQANISRA